LSFYLRHVRAGAEVVIHDRQTPIGKVIPLRREAEDREAVFAMIEPKEGYEGLARLSFPRMRVKKDPLDFLWEDRRRS
jgi:antitoxin (DNA-binding transcriptional repressor) of toxin-antitoxin stability system